jgi:hypothetical protein
MLRVSRWVSVTMLLVVGFWLFSTPPWIANATDSLDQGLVGYWKFDEGRGDIAFDQTLNHNDGKLVNGPAWVQGKYGTALQFDGKSTFVEVPDTNVLRLANQFTISAWVKASNFSGQRWIIDKGYNAYRLLLNGTKAQFQVNGIEVLIDSRSSLLPGVWYQVAATYDGTLAKLYLNGNLEMVQTRSTSAQQTNSSLISGAAATKSSATVFNGILDDVHLYNRALGEQEVNALFQKVP